MLGLTPLMTVAAWLELVGSLLLVLGLFTRLVAFVLPRGRNSTQPFLSHNVARWTQAA